MGPNPLRPLYKMNTVIDISVETPVSTELLSAATVKDRLKIETTDEDTMIGLLISEGRSLIEQYTGLSIGEQERTVVADLESEYKLPYPPIDEMSTVLLKDTTYAASTDYTIDGVLFKSFIPDYAGRWKITYSCGYTSENLPGGLKNAWIDLVGYMYENRGDMSIPINIKQKLNAYTRKYGI
jgi:hypothetical protein